MLAGRLLLALALCVITQLGYAQDEEPRIYVDEACAQRGQTTGEVERLIDEPGCRSRWVKNFHDRNSIDFRFLVTLPYGRATVISVYKTTAR